MWPAEDLHNPNINWGATALFAATRKSDGTALSETCWELEQCVIHTCGPGAHVSEVSTTQHQVVSSLRRDTHLPHALMLDLVSAASLLARMAISLLTRNMASIAMCARAHVLSCNSCRSQATRSTNHVAGKHSYKICSSTDELNMFCVFVGATLRRTEYTAQRESPRSKLSCS